MAHRDDKTKVRAHSLPARIIAYTSSFAVAVSPSLPLYADVIASGQTSTIVATTGSVSDVTTGTIANGIAYNAFSQFNVGTGETVNLYQPGGTQALVNVVNDASRTPSTINGTLNARVGDPGSFSNTGSNVFIVDHNGFVVGANGIINANRLTLSTATQAFGQALIDEATSGDGSIAQQLFDGEEELSASDIETYGVINASRLDLRAGARLVLGGRIDVIDSGPGASGVVSVVNTDEIAEARGVTTEGGVLRFTAGNAEVSGQINARRNGAGGMVTGSTSGDMTLEDSARINVQGGANTDAAGSVLLFAEGSAFMEAGLQINATSVAGNGGFIFIEANFEDPAFDPTTSAVTLATPSIRAQGQLLTSGGIGDAAGVTWLSGETVEVVGNLVTAGGNLMVQGDEGVVVRPNAVIDTRSVSPSIAAGDVIVSAPAIVMQDGSSIIATGASTTNTGGLVALIARDITEESRWNINVENNKALIRLENATIRAGAVVLNAFAQTGNVLGELDNGVTEAEFDAFEAQQAGFEDELVAFLDTIETTVVDVFEQGVSALQGIIPVQVQVMSADARIEITDSDLTAEGNWKGKSLTVDSAFDGDAEARGLFSAAGLLEGRLALLGETAPSILVALPTIFDPANDAMFIHAHSQTDVTIAPKAFGLGVGVSVTNTDSRVTISDSNLTSLGLGPNAARDIAVRSTATENLDVSIAASPIAGISVGVVVAVHALRNQLVIDGGSITSARALDVGAFSARSHSLTAAANGGKDGKGAVALNIEVGNALTEAALGGTIRTQGDLNLAAETLYFAKAHDTSATLGLADPLKTAINKLGPVATLKGKVTEVTNKIKERISGKKEGESSDKAGFAFGLAFDLQLDRDDTYASLGGQYRDLANGNALVDLGATSVQTGRLGSVNVSSTLRFASALTEGGSELSRTVSSSMGFLDRIAELELQRQNAIAAAAGLPQVTKEDIIGQFGNAVFLNGSVMLMSGETQAEIGANAEITQATAVNVNATTLYPEFDRFIAVRDEFIEFGQAVAEFELIEEGEEAGTTVNTPPAIPDIVALADLGNYLTTYTGAYAEQNQLDNPPAGQTETKSQDLAVAISVNVFNTDNATRAVVRDGARIDLSDAAGDLAGDVSVTALQRGLFTHMQNFPTDLRTVTDPIGSNDNLANTVGGALTLSRTVSRVEALIEGDAELTAETVDLDAHNRAIVFNLVYAGGAAENVAINAAIAAQAVENVTIARLSDQARITTGALTINALDDSFIMGLAGAFAGSDGSVSVGASGVVNFSKRQVYAGIGPAERGAALGGTAGDVRITADTLTITANNDAITVATAVAGSRVSGKPTGSSTTPPEEETNDEDTIIPSWLFAEDETDALSAQNNISTPADSTGSDQNKTGWSVAGAATVNLMLQNETVTEVASNGRIELGGALNMTATNTSFGLAGAGAISVGLGTTQKNNALAGAFAITVDERDVRALVRGANITAQSGTVRADDDSVVIGVAVGGAGSSNGKVTLAGSVAVNVLTGETQTDVSDATLSMVDDLGLYASDESLTVGVGGAVSINMSKSEGAGVGIGIAVNVVDRGASTRVSGSSLLDARDLTVEALSRVQIFGFGISAGAGKTGVAGSVAVNTITGGARVIIGNETGARVVVKADSLTARAEEENQIWSLAGALTFGRTGAYGGALTANVIVVTTGAEVVNTDVTARDLPPTAPADAEEPVLGAVTVTAESSSLIGTLAVAGALSLQGQAVGVGLSGNTITADLTASLAGSTVVDAGLVSLQATNGRTIRSLGGGVAGSGKGAGGFAATLNLLIANDTTVDLNGADISTRTGDITATAEATGTIETLAVAISASQGSAIGGAATVNVSTGATKVTANDARLVAGGSLTLSALDDLTIRSLAGGAAVSIGGAGVGAAIAANVIANDTLVEANNAELSSEGGDLALLATNDALIRSIAIGLAVSDQTAVSGSIAIGYIGNETRVTAAGTSLVAGTEGVEETVDDPAIPEVRRAITLAADKSSTIEILSGAVAGSGNVAVGLSVTVAVIQDTVTADLVANERVFGGELNVTATNEAVIDAIAVAGAVSSNVAVSGSVVYTQIGKPPESGPSVPVTSTPAASSPEPDETDDPIGDGRQKVDDERDAALVALGARSGFDGSIDLAGTDDLTRARLALSATDVDVAGIVIEANEIAATRSLAGSVAASGNVGVGFAVGVNLLFGRTEAELVIPEGVTARTNAADVRVAATQTGTIETLTGGLGAAGSVGGAGAILVNVFERTLMARVVGADTDSSGGVVGAALATDGGDVVVELQQTGEVFATSAVVAGGGVAGAGGAFGVTVLSDEAAASVEDVLVNTAQAATGGASQTLLNAGLVNILATSNIDLLSIVAAAAVGGKGAFGGSVAVNVAESSVTAALRRSTVYADQLRVDALAVNSLSANSGSLAIGGFVSGAMGVATNVSRMTVLADVDGSTVRAQRDVVIEADAQTTMSGIAIGGSASLGVAISGTGLGNSAENTVSALVRNTGAETAIGGSDIVTRGSALVRAAGTNIITLSSAEDVDIEDPGLNLNLTVGGAGIGVAVSVNETANEVTSGITDQSRIVGLGATAITDARLGTFRGVGFDAFADTSISIVTVNASAGAVAAVAGLLTFNIVSDAARVRIGGIDSGESALVNTTLGDSVSAADIALLGGSIAANAQQDTVLQADVSNEVESFTVGVAIGGGASVGAASGNNLIESTAEIDLGFASVAAVRDIRANAAVETDLDAWVLGLGGGWVGAAGSVEVNIIDTAARIAVRGSQLDAGRDLTLETHAMNDIFTVAGGVAVGAVGVAGGFVVNVMDSTSEIVVTEAQDSNAEPGEPQAVRSVLAADRNVTLQADTTNTTKNYAGSAAVAGVAVALAANVNLVKSTTRVDIGARNWVRAGELGTPNRLGNVVLRANEYTDIEGTSGSLAGALFGAGASLDYVNFAANTAVRIGADAQVRATGSLTAAALARRELASSVGVASATIAGISAAVSVIEMGGLSTEGQEYRNDNLALVQESLNEDQDTGSAGDDGRASDVAAYAGGADVRSRMVAARQSVDVTGDPTVDDVGVSIGDRAVLESVGNMSLSSLAELAVVQRVGGAAAAYAVGITATVGVVTVETDSSVLFGNNVRVRSDAAASFTARVAGLNNGIAVDSDVGSLAASGLGSVSAGVSAVSANASARIEAGQGAVFGGYQNQRALSITFNAERTDRVQAKVFNVAAALGGAVGVAVARATNDGRTVVRLGGTGASQIDSNALTIGARDSSLVRSVSEGSAGGLFASANGADANALSRGEVRVSLTNVTVMATSVALNNRSSARAEAEAKGISVAGGLSIGTSIATARINSTVATTMAGGSIMANTVNLSTGIDAAQGTNAYAWSNSSSGGILSANGAESKAWLDYAVSTTLRGSIIAGTSLTVVSDAASARSRAVTDGKSFGLAAIGLVFAQTGQSSGNTASVSTVLESGTFYGRNVVSITSSNAPDMGVDVSSGTGGLLQGSGAEAFVTVNTRTETLIGSVGLTNVAGEVGVGTVAIAASHGARVDSVLDNRAGALIGASGANARTTVLSRVETDIGGQARISGRDIDISAGNNVLRPYREYNIKSASGGAIDVPAMISRVTVDAFTDLRVRDGAAIAQMGDVQDPGTFNLGIATSMSLADRLFLDAGGAVAVPIGDSNVQVRSNFATVTIGAATLLGLGEMSIYNGGNANVLAEVDSTSYGLAGAATSITRATYNAANVIRLQDGALLESLGDIRLMAGHVKTSLQSVTVRAEARAFNKTAFPINIDPVADATANTISLVDIGEGSLVTSVRDIYLLSEAGQRNVVGYGRGKDLYRQAAEDVANFFGGLVGADDVSLDIETGSSVDLSNDGILVNGKVRAGSRNKQVLILGLDAFGNYALLNETTPQSSNSDEFYEADWAKDIVWNVRRNVAPSVDLQARVDELNSYLNNPGLSNSSGDRVEDGVLVSSTDPARQAWISELATLRTRLASVANLRVDWVDLGPILAVEGNIIMRADYVQGTQTGELHAPGDALIKVWIESGAWLETDSMTIPTAEGGRITMNDVLVNNTNDVRIQSQDRAGPYAFNMISGEDGGEPKIEVVTFTPDVGARGDGTIIIGGEILNLRGEALINSNAGSIDIRNDISARTIRVTANADIFVGYKPGVTNAGPAPQGQYLQYFNAVQDRLRFNFFAVPRTGSPGALFFGPPIVPTDFVLLPTESALKAGRNVYITSDVLNVNGLIQAGTGTFDVTILAGIEAELDALRLQGRTGRILIHDTAFPANVRVAKSDNVQANTNVKVYYNFDTDRIELDDIFVRGGTVVITGKIISTGNGRIEALDGFGRVNINSAATTDLVINRIDLGGETDSARGLAGLVRITDTSRRIANGSFLITDFVRNNGAIEVYNNAGPIGTIVETVVIGTNADGTDETIATLRPGDLVSRSTANGGRSGTYQTTPNQDLIYVTAERTTITWTNFREVLVIIGISGTTSEERRNYNVQNTNVTEALGIAPYVGASLGDYAYAVRGNYYVESFVEGPERKTHDSVRWWKLGSGWRHFEKDFTEVRLTRYEHRLKADYPISIFFNGSDSAEMNVNSVGNVIFARTVINELGTTNVTSTNGSILTGSSNVVLNTSDTVLSAVNGSIRGLDGEFRMNQTATGTLRLVAGDGINVREQQGNMNIVSAETLRRPAGNSTAQIGTVRLTAQGSILQVDDDSIVRGSDIILTAQDGSLGLSADDTFRIDTDGGNLTATARNSIFIEETTGDLGVREVQSRTADVTLIALDGSILDRNNNETRDIRTLEELQQLWGDEIGLYGDAAIERRTDELLANLESERTQLYQDYWTRRGTGDSATFTLAPEVEAGLRRTVVLENGTVVPGWDDARIAAYVAERQALFDQWNATETAFDPARRITVTVDDLDPAMLDTIAWSEDSLQRSIRSSLVRVRETGDTNIRVETPNVRAAGNITLIAGDAIGELSDDYVINSSAGTLSNADLEVLFTAERQDIVVDTARGEIRVRRNENLDFAFEAVDGDLNSLGSLRAIAGTQEVFMAAETPATIARVESTGRVDLRINGNMADNAAPGSTAVRGGIIILEAGNSAAIGTADKPLTVDVIAGGSLTARAGLGVHILAPFSDLPLREVFSRGPVSLVSVGAITDLVGDETVPRIIAGGDLLLDGGSIGTDTALLGIRMDDTEEATARIFTRTGDVNLKSFSDLPLETAQIAGGGRIVMDTGRLLQLLATDTVRFGLASRLVLVLPTGVDTALSTGTDFTGGTLDVRTGGTFGTEDKPVTSDLAVLDYTALNRLDALLDTSLWLRDIGSLRLETALMNANTEVVTNVYAAVDLSVGVAESVALAQLEAGRDLTDGRIIAERAELISVRDMGNLSRIDVTAAEFQAETIQDGSAWLLLRDRDVEVDFITLDGTGALDLIARNAATTLLSGPGITTQTGNLLMRVEDLRLIADVSSVEGNVDIGVDGDLTTETAVKITTDAGTLRLAVTGDATIGDDNLIRTLNATDTALYVGVDGQLVVGRQGTPLLQANAAGALTTLRFGSVLNTGPVGVRTQVARLDSVTRAGDIHLREEDGITVEQIIAEDGNVDLYTLGDTVLRRAEALGTNGGTVVIGSGGSLLGDSPDLVGTLLKLYAFGGRLGGETAGTTMEADTASDAEVWLLARDGLDYTERLGNLRLALGASLDSDATIRVAAGSLTAGVLGASGTLSVEAVGTLDVNLIGRTAIDIADEVGLELVDNVPTRYGIYDIPSPERLVMRALGEGSLVRLGLGNVRDMAELYGDTLDANLYDVTPTDGLRLRLADDSGAGFALTDVNVIGDGPQIDLTVPFQDVRPLLAGRFLAKLRPEDRTQSTADGEVIIEFARIQTGQVTNAGPSLIGEDIVINGDVWFRQRTFDLLATIVYRNLDITADAQVLAWRFEPGETRPVTGKISFDLSNEIELLTWHVFPLNRRLGGVSLNGGQGFVFGVGAETQIMVNPFLRNIGDPGTVTPLFSTTFGSGVTSGEDPVLSFPLLLASL